MLWHRQTIFESKGDKLFTSAECRIRTQGSKHLFASKLNACWQTDWSIQDQANKLELDSPSLWSASIQPTWPHCHLAFAPGSSDIHICCCEFRCSGTGKRFSNRKETSCLPLLKAGFEPRGSQTPIRQQTECLLTNRLSYRGSSKNLNSTALPYDQQAFSPPDPTSIWHSHLALAIYIFVVVNFDAMAQASDFRIERRQVVFLCWRQDSNPEGLRHIFASRLNACWQTHWAIEDQAKTWTRQPVPMISKHSAHLTSLPVGFRTWLWRYTCLLLLISMLWHRQAIFESKGDKLFSSAECRIRTQGLRHLLASRLNACWQTDWAIEDQAKTWTRQPVPMISKHSAHSTSLPVGFRTWLWWYTCLLLLFWCSGTGKRFSNRKETSCLPLLKAGFEPKVSDTYSPANWMPADKTTDLSRIKLTNLSLTARPYDQQAFSPPDPTAIWYSHLALAIYTFVVVNFDALAQASDFRIERRQVVFLCWRQDSNPEGLRHLFASRLNACWQTDWAIEDQAKTWTRQPVPMISKHSAHSTSLPVGFRTWLWWYTCLLLFVVVNFDALAQANDFRIKRRLVVFLCWRQDSNPEGLRHIFASRLNACWQTDWAIEDQAKTWTRQPVPMISKHSAHLTPLPFGIGTWLWRYTYLLLLISMLWHRQAIFESKGDKLSSSAEGRIRTQRVSDTYSPADWMPADKPTELSRIKQKIELDSPSLWSASIQPTRPHCHLAFAPGSSDIHICCCEFRCSGTGKRFSNRKETSCFPMLNAGFEPKVSDTYSPADWMPADKPTELSRIKLKNLNSTARPYYRTANFDILRCWWKTFHCLKRSDCEK